MAVNRAESQQLADVRTAEAQALLAAGLWDGAYDLAGYAVEFTLKACIAKLTKAEEYPPHRRFIDDYYTHDINRLARTAKLVTALDADLKSDPAFAINWDTANGWTEESRYARKSEVAARELLAALTDPQH